MAMFYLPLLILALKENELAIAAVDNRQALVAIEECKIGGLSLDRYFGDRVVMGKANKGQSAGVAICRNEKTLVLR